MPRQMLYMQVGNIVKRVSLRKLPLLAALLFLCFGIFGCNDDPTPEPTPAPTLTPTQVTAIADQISASVKQTLRDELAKTQPPLSDDEIRRLIEDVVKTSVPEGISSAEIQAIVDAAISERSTDQITAIAIQFSAAVQQIIRDELAMMRPPLSKDEITALLQVVLNQSSPQGISDSDIQKLVDGVILALPAESVVQEDLIAAIRQSLAEVCAACGESDENDGNNVDIADESDKGRLQKIQERGRLICAVNFQFPGFGFLDEDGHPDGFDIDLCRAVATAVFGDPNAVEFRVTEHNERAPSLQSGEIDLLSRNTTWTASRDASWGNFTHTMFHGGQGFIVPRSIEIASVYDLEGATICVLQGTNAESNLQNFSIQNNMGLRILTRTSSTGTGEAYLQGQCDSLTAVNWELLQLASRFPDPAAHVILPEVISEEPLGPVVPHGDDQWFDVVKSVMAMLIYSEAYGIHSDNVPTANTGDPDIDRLFGLGGSYNQAALGLKVAAAQDVIRQVGNYGQIYDRHLTPLGLVREGSRNALWIGAPCEDCPKGGQIYAPPFR